MDPLRFHTLEDTPKEVIIDTFFKQYKRQIDSSEHEFQMTPQTKNALQNDLQNLAKKLRTKSSITQTAKELALTFVNQFQEIVLSKGSKGSKGNKNSKADIIFYPEGVSDIEDYIILESVSEAGDEENVFTLESISEIQGGDDHIAKALLEVNRLEQEQAHRRNALIQQDMKQKKKVSLPSPFVSTSKSDNTQLPSAPVGSMYIVHVVPITKSKNKYVDAFNVAEQMKKNLFRLYKRVSSSDWTRVVKNDVTWQEVLELLPKPLEATLKRQSDSKKNDQGDAFFMYTSLWYATFDEAYDAIKTVFGVDTTLVTVALLYDGKFWVSSKKSKGNVVVVKRTRFRTQYSFSPVFFVQQTCKGSQWMISWKTLSLFNIELIAP